MADNIEVSNDGVSFKLIPAEIPDHVRRRGHKENVHDKAVAAFVGSSEKSVKVVLEGVPVEKAIRGLRAAVTRSHKGKVKVISRLGEVYLERL